MADRDLGCVLVVCGSIVNSAYAVDNSPATAASISPPLAIGTAALRVGFDAPIPAGAQVSMMVSFTGSALSLGLVNNTTISTFAASGSQAKQTMTMNSLLNLTTLNTNVMNVEFTATNKFQELELRTGSVLAVNVGYAVQLYQATATYTPLPVELTRFAGTAQGNEVALKWATASEKNSAYYQVERATAEAPERYQAIGRVAAAGSSSQALAYDFVDAQPLEMGYYRLKQVDKDGSSAYSPVVAVRATPTLALQAYPNPTTGRLTVAGAKDTRFVLVDQLGQVVQQGTLALSQTYELDFSNQPNGLYFLRDLATGATVKVAKTASGKAL
ncbi:hypothetical protein GCM10027345_04200 [Hymenobacter daeguensis]